MRSRCSACCSRWLRARTATRRSNRTCAPTSHASNSATSAAPKTRTSTSLQLPSSGCAAASEPAPTTPSFALRAPHMTAQQAPVTMNRFADTREFLHQIRTRVGKVVVGQDVVVERVLISLLTSGHLLLQGVPGLAKTLLVAAVSKTVDLA